MRKVSLVAVVVFVVGVLSSCAVGYHDRYRNGEIYTEPEFYGTVSYVDPVAHRIDLDYVGAGGRHFTRGVYYDEHATRWNGMAYSDVRPGAIITVRGRNDHGRYRLDSVDRRH